MTNEFEYEDGLAASYQRAVERYKQSPWVVELYDATDVAYDRMVEAIHEREHEIDTCQCTSCTLYRQATETGEDNPA